MYKLLIIVLLFSIRPSFGLELDPDWKDCNLPANKALCEAEFADYQAHKAALQKQYQGQALLRKVCEELQVCGGGSGGAGGAGAGG